MKIYFSGSILGGCENEAIYLEIAVYLREKDYNVLSLHVARPDLLPKYSAAHPQAILSRDIKWIEDCDAIVAEVSTPSLGVGYEICYGLQIGNPILCLYKEGIKLSQMILGNTHPNIQVHSYSDTEELKTIIDKFFSTKAISD